MIGVEGAVPRGDGALKGGDLLGGGLRARAADAKELRSGRHGRQGRGP